MMEISPEEFFINPLQELQISQTNSKDNPCPERIKTLHYHNFMNTITTTCNQILHKPRWNQFTNWKINRIKFILRFPPYLRLRLPSIFFPPGLTTLLLQVCPIHPIFLNLVIQTLLHEVTILRCSAMCTLVSLSYIFEYILREGRSYIHTHTHKYHAKLCFFVSEQNVGTPKIQSFVKGL